ncbi:tripartite tricarboxylate transporter TctB family protein [Nitratidesulfovibrio sp. 1201_IL3209]|jgi:hypothetical protein|uniref:tripartite tricarboxylate transporter TctB family protein n=1 Tax=Nitratidesulfovibrio sp. 1201_IL3209 TaxID=3084053 RepID=UPI002FDAD7B9
MRSSVADIASGLAVLVMAGVFHAQSGDLEGVSLLFPRMLVIFMALGGIYLCGLGMLKGRKGGDAPQDDEPVAVGRVGIISAGAIAYVAIIPLLGFYLASALYLFGMSMVLGDASRGTRRKALASAAFTVVLCLSVWIGFAMLLGVPTPEGMLF